MTTRKKLVIALTLICGSPALNAQVPGRLSVSSNHRYFVQNGKPFFWLGDTGWLLFSKLNRQEAETYLENRREKGFNVIQVMVLHDLSEKNVYGDAALIGKKIAKPLITSGNSFEDKEAYDYWDHVDYVIDLAEKKGLYMALVPVWGSAAKSGRVTGEQAESYAKFLAKRYGSKRNIIWMNGGDIPGNDHLEVWQAIGNTLRKLDKNHLITYHPRGRTPSSQWFHNESWLDFNSFQSGHRRYDQDTTKTEKYHYGEDNWKFAAADYKLKPVKPTLDSEPSYEGIPQGLHDTTEIRWKDKDVRRYAYWSVFAGGCGFTYGNNSVMQFLQNWDKGSAYGAKDLWSKAIDDAGAGQMRWLKKLMLSRPYLERIPDQTLVVNQEEKYGHIQATRGKRYAFVYTYTGRNLELNMGKLEGKQVKASWYDPRSGKTTVIGTLANKGIKTFDPPGEMGEGNDWVLILDSL